MKNDESSSGIPGILVLEDGESFEGELFGAPVSAESIRAASRQNRSSHTARDRGYGEVVFNTSMTGYQEILTDPSYYGQIVCMTAAHIGNTGVNEEDPESQHPWCGGFVVKQACDHPSNWRSQGDLDGYLKRHGVPGISDVDTRALTRHLRSRGVSRGVILPLAEREKAPELFRELPAFEGRDLIGEVTTRESYHWPNHGKEKGESAAGKRFRVVAVDFGVKWNLLRSLARLGCDIEVVPANTSAKAILERKPHGVFLSNGPGDPSAAPYAAMAVRELIGKVPIFGVCMGHQILGIALGAKTYKLKFGHRGGNQPVLDRETGRVEISSHNHGYAVDPATLPPEAQVTHVNLNDKCCEGMAMQSAKAFSVQYHPEACPGPHDSMVLFDQFIRNMQENVSKIS